MVKKKKGVSYYDTKDKDKYLADGKNLKKIRSKSLRTFCEFVKLMEDMPMILAASDKDVDFDIMENPNFIRNILGDLKKRQRTDWKELEDLAKSAKVGVNWISKRTVYDYIWAYKYILACKGRGDRTMDEMLKGVGK